MIYLLQQRKNIDAPNKKKRKKYWRFKKVANEIGKNKTIFALNRYRESIEDLKKIAYTDTEKPSLPTHV